MPPAAFTPPGRAHILLRTLPSFRQQRSSLRHDSGQDWTSLFERSQHSSIRGTSSSGIGFPILFVIVLRPVRRGWVIRQAAIFDDLSILQLNQPVSLKGEFFVVGHNHEGCSVCVIEFSQKFE